MKRTEHPFRFVTASYLTRIGNHQARTLRELEVGLKGCSDAFIFYHTFQSLGRFHFLTEGFSNDFSYWSETSLGLPRLAKRINKIDIYTNTLESAREQLLALAKEELAR